MLYFAYGSNIDEQRIKAPERCPNSRYLFNALLPGHRLVFSHRTESGAAADVITDPASSVWGVVYDITETDRKQLDNREAAIQRAHRPREVLVHPHGDKDQRIMVITYALLHSVATEHHAPSREYLDSMLRGARQRGFPAPYIAELEKIKTA